MIALVVGLVATLIGIVYRRLRNRVNDLEDRVDDIDEENSGIHQKLDTVFSWAFGNEEDSTDRGFSGDMDEQFGSVVTQLENMQTRIDEKHDEIHDRIDDLILALHDEDSLEFERDDVE
ncbi:hypothetical protein [Natronoglomus mannanivorans]|uniref:Uncharacterized protein n=1 Tax=Natronoglomus mannanivorans TaxID=2979990 RepID=A0AAP2Z4N2_9EURY|nr:hypothetical protein [Halobacteria archaeon AArc-xg1-1]